MVQQNDIQFDVLPIKLSDVCHSNFYACFYMETTRNDGWNNNNGKYRTTKLLVYHSLNNFIHDICNFFQIFAFGFMSTLARRRTAIKDFQKEHPLLVTLIVLLIGHWLIYKLASILVILLGLLLPICFMIIHASCRMRNIANKLNNAAQVMGFKNVTPMGYLLESIGIEPNFKYN